MKIFSWIKRLKKDLDTETYKSVAQSKKNRRRIERSLVSRLRILGFILLGFSILFLFYAFTYSPSETLLMAASQAEEAICEEFLPHETLNFFIVSGIFLILAAACIFTSWKQSQDRGK